MFPYALFTKFPIVPPIFLYLIHQISCCLLGFHRPYSINSLFSIHKIPYCLSGFSSPYSPNSLLSLRFPQALFTKFPIVSYLVTQIVDQHFVSDISSMVPNFPCPQERKDLLMHVLPSNLFKCHRYHYLSFSIYSF